MSDASLRTIVEQERDQLQQSLQVLRTNYASVVQALDTERATSLRDREQALAAEAAVAQALERQRSLERELDEAVREAESLVRRNDEHHAARVETLEQEVALSAARIAELVDERDRAHAVLQVELSRAAERHSRLIDSDLFGYAVTTTTGELVRCNDAFAHLFGYRDASDAMARAAGTIIPRLANRPPIADRLAADGHATRVDGCLERVDGKSIRVLQTATLLRADADAEVPVVEHVLLGMSGEPDNEELRARRLEAVGVLASEMAPELEALAATLTTDVARDPRQAGLVAHHIGALVRQLAAFSRRQLMAPQAVDLSRVVSDVAPTLTRLVGDYIAFSTDLQATMPVSAHVDDLDQIITSLVALGRDLLPAGGSIIVETRPSAADANGDDASNDTPSGPVVAVTASGYGVQLPERATALEQVASRAGGELKISGEAGWTVRLAVSFSRCRSVSRSRWEWLD